MADDMNSMSAYGSDRPKATSFVVAESLNDVSGAFNDQSITYNGSLTGTNYETILRQKEQNINTLYQLGDYFADADDLVNGAIHHVLVPFSTLDGYYLEGGEEKTRAKYEEWFERISLDTKLRSWFYQYYVFSNVYYSLMEDGDLVTLPPHMMRVSNVLIHGNPLVEFNVRALKQSMRKNSQKALKKFLDDEQDKVRLAGYPAEVAAALSGNAEWVQLDPKSTWMWQGDKPEWSRYAIPMIAAALIPLGQKALIRNQENSLLNLSAASFVHAAVGSPKDSNIVVDNNILRAILEITKGAMKAGAGAAVTNDCVKYEVIQPDMDHFYEADKYRNANAAILGAFGINATVSSGADNAVSFGSSQISTKLVSMRITDARKSLCKLMNKIMRAVNGAPYGLPRSNESKIPVFKMRECDLTQVAAFREECQKLYDKGVLSIQTLLDSHGIDIKREFDRKQAEADDGMTKVFVAPGKEAANTDDGSRGRPTLDDNERESDPGNSETGRNPKPSVPEGSEPQE